MISGRGTSVLATNRTGGGVDVQVNTTLNPLTNNTKLITIGDSLVSGVYAEDAARTILYYTTNLYLTKYVTFATNAGLAGRTAWNLYLAATNELAQFAPVGNNRTIILSSMGFNDIAYGSNIQNTIYAVSNFAFYCKSANMDLWITTLHHQQAEISPVIAQNRQSYNAWVRTNTLCRYVDWERVSPSFEGVTTDTLHWNTNMNARLAKHFVQTMSDYNPINPLQSGGFFDHLTVSGEPKAYRGENAMLKVEGTYPAIYFNADGGVYTNSVLMTVWNGGLLFITKRTNNASNFEYPRDYSISFNESGLLVWSNATAKSYILNTNFGETAGPVGITNGLSAFWNSNGTVTFLRASVKGYTTNKDVVISEH